MGAEASKPGVGPAFVKLSKEAVPASDTAFWKCVALALPVFCLVSAISCKCAVLIPPSAARSTVLSGNTPTYAAIPADAVRNTIKVNPQNIALLSRMAVGKLAKAAEGKGSMSQVCSRLQEKAERLLLTRVV